MEHATARSNGACERLRGTLRFALAFALAGSPQASAAGLAAGRALYSACAPCHGVRGEGVAKAGAPSLAGQERAYLIRQLEAFRSGLRGADPADAEGGAMRGVAAGLEDAAIADLVTFVETLPEPVTPITVTGDLRSGSNTYQAKCNACHGPRAEGNPALHAPRLAGVSDGYLLRQLSRFRTGVRGGRPEDRLGRQMALMARGLPSEQAERDVIAFIRSLAERGGAPRSATKRKPD